ncbi:MAG TPA: ATP-dependent DNA helicase RecG [bacterium]|nr:ATP-dependent DNA helicase RecG [bacterium]
MSAEDDLGQALRLLRKPLEYASGLSPARLQIMPDLGRTLLAILDRHPASSPALSEFRSALDGLDELSGNDRMTRVITLIRILDRVEKKAGAPSMPGPERGRDALTAEEQNLLALFKDLDSDAQYVKGVGPWVAEKLARLGVLTVEDLLYHLPSRYEDRRDLVKIRDTVVGKRATVYAEVMVCGPVTRRGNRRMFHMLISDGTGVITATWFKYAGDYLEKRFKKGQMVLASGAVREYGKNLEMHHPDVEVVEAAETEDDLSSLAGIVPIYPSTEGLHQKSIRRIAGQALALFNDKVPEALPPELVERRSLLPPGQALALCHVPPDEADIVELNAFATPAHRRLVYEELFWLELGLALRRRGLVEEPAAAVKSGGHLLEKFRASLPFKFTRAQEKVLAEIQADMARPYSMHRLLQGDVGSGKTVVALAAALLVIEAGHQAAIMAPTELLAEQHYRTVSMFFKDLPVRAALHTGSVRGQERDRVIRGIEDGSLDLVIGTHALIQEKVRFKGLALGIIDEQHRFGVMQRARLKAKSPEGLSPHLLVMTATPIPRTLAMTLYGDLAVSVIREMPPGRTPVATRLFSDRDRDKVYAEIRKEAGRGRQVFMVYPLVEESEGLELRDATTMAEHLRNDVFPDLRVGLVHGRMKAEEKDQVMRLFHRGELNVLVATTVIEVGIDVPNASLMVIEHAERFGLSQLHQLRGRVGRGAHASRCILVAGYVPSEDAFHRLKVMEKLSDGFKIAEEDLAMRGPGEFFGTRQSGLPDFRVANIIRDAEVLQDARADAFELVNADPGLSEPGHLQLRGMLRRRWGKGLKLGTVG